MAGPQDYTATKNAVAAANKAKAAAKPKPPAKPIPTPKPAATPAAAPKSKTTPNERARESGAMYGSENTGVVPRGAATAAADEGKRESGASYGSGNVGNDNPTSIQTAQTYFAGADNIDAFEELKNQLIQWGLGSLANSFMSLATQGFKPSEAMNKIKYDTTINPATNKPWNFEYGERFAGNAARIKQGLNAYSEAEYLRIEDSYTDTLRRNNLSNLLSVDAAANQKKFAKYMEAGLSADEFANRIDTYYERVDSMDPKIKAQFQAYYPGIKDTDIVSYLADPENTMPVLKNKITAAEIGAAAIRTGLSATSKSSAEEMAKAGKSVEEAEAGYRQIGGFLSDAELYSQIYKEEGINYNQTTAEQDIIMGNADAGKKRKRLESKARAAFEGSSGRLRTGQQQGNTGQF